MKKLGLSAFALSYATQFNSSSFHISDSQPAQTPDPTSLLLRNRNTSPFLHFVRLLSRRRRNVAIPRSPLPSISPDAGLSALRTGSALPIRRITFAIEHLDTDDDPAEPHRFNFSYDGILGRVDTHPRPVTCSLRSSQRSFLSTCVGDLPCRVP
jgi:hypothetical protein